MWFIEWKEVKADVAGQEPEFGRNITDTANPTGCLIHRYTAVRVGVTLSEGAFCPCHKSYPIVRSHFSGGHGGAQAHKNNHQ